MNRQGKQRNRNAFTLVELVVVIVMAIVLLVVLIWPSMATVRERARRVNCMANMNQVWKAMSAWGLDSTDSYRNALDKVPPGDFICPSAGRLCKTKPDTNCYYQYYSSRRDTDGDKVLLCDMHGPNQIAGPNAWGGNHDGKGGNVVKVAGSGHWVVATNYPGIGCVTNPEIAIWFSTNNEVQILPLNRQQVGDEGIKQGGARYP